MYTTPTPGPAPLQLFISASSAKLILLNVLSLNARGYQSLHCFSGFILVPFLHWNALWNASRLRSVPVARQ